MRLCKRPSRVGVTALPILLVLILATSVNGQGLFSGLPGVPFLGSFMGGCGAGHETVCPKVALEAYVGYMDHPNGTTVTVDQEPSGLGQVYARNQYPTRGMWFGLSGSAWLNANLSFIGSGWYLLPSQSSARHDVQYSVGPPTGRSWDVDTHWWYVDGLFVLNDTWGATLLAGLRYDYFDISFKNPSEIVGAGWESDTADRTSRTWIPLVGTQVALSSGTGSLLFRVVGFPTVLGSSTFKQTIAGASRLETSGNYDSGYFLEVFAEASKTLGAGSVGIFGRWDTLVPKTTHNSDFATPAGVTNEESRVVMRRQAWTFGGSFNLNFYSPI